MLKMYSKHLTTAANTAKQAILEKQFNVPATIRALAFETSDTLGADLTVRGYLGGEVFLYDSDAKTLQIPDWIPVNAGPRTLRGKIRIEVDNSHATNVPDIKVIALVDVGKTPPNNLPWIHGGYGAASTADLLAAKQFDKEAVFSWMMLNFSAGDFILKIGDSRINGDDEGFVDEPITPSQGIAYPFKIPANVDLKGTTVAATGSFIVVVQKPW